MRKVTLRIKRCKFDMDPCKGCVLSPDGVIPCGNDARINDKSNQFFCGEQLGNTRKIWVIDNYK